MKTSYIFFLMTLLFVATSCEDWFSNPPESEMVKEDFWKKKGDVESAIGACYRGLTEQGVIERLIVWGEVRSDNVIDGKSFDDNINKILTANITATNGYTRWDQFYSCINNCNTLIANASGVLNEDPDFSEAELNQYLAEAKAIRAFCYFTLVKTFRDVPFTTEPYEDDSKDFFLPQTDGDEILRTLLNDLKSVESQAPVMWNDNVPYTKGRITRKAIWALEADIALWLNQYEECVAACDKVLTTTANPISLERSSAYFNNVFFRGNSDESIWELQFDQNVQNGAVQSMYGLNTDYRLSSYDFTTYGSSTDLFSQAHDLRRMNALVESGAYFAIKKYIALRTNTTNVKARESDFMNGEPISNWIIYRLPDIYLMKAEALAELGGDTNLQQAVELCSRTFDRANPDMEEGSLIGQYSSQNDVRNLVLTERQREFLYEGKRYFDLMRLMRRNGNPEQVLETYLRKKYESIVDNWSLIKPKLNDPDAIYMPVNDDELRANPYLQQNRFYQTSSDITR